MKLNRNKHKNKEPKKVETKEFTTPKQESKLDRIERKIDKLADSHIELYQEQAKITTEVKLNRVSLEEHMRRTEALEKQVGPKYLFKVVSGVSVFVTAFIKIIGLLEL